MDEHLYKAHVACRICGVTPRMLDYWITKAVICPTAAYRARAGKRDLFLFSFEDLVRIRIVRSLRDSGMSLAKITTAVKCLKRLTGPEWQREWIVSDGKRLYRRTGGDALETLSGSGQGQLAFAVVALGPTCDLLQQKIKEYKSFEHAPLRGNVRRYQR